MTGDDKNTDKITDDITADGAVELDEDALGEAQGGAFKGVDGLNAEIKTDRTSFEAWPSKWKVNGFDGKGNDVVSEEITIKTKNVYPKIE